MRGAVLYGRSDVRCIEREDWKLIEPTDAIIQISATYVRVRPVVLSGHGADG